MISTQIISLLDMVLCMAEAIDLISPAVANHHNQVAYITLSLSEMLNLPPEKQSDLVIAAALHDIGSMSLKDRLECMEAEPKNPFAHTEAGFYLLNRYPLFSETAKLVRFHHISWEGGSGTDFLGNAVPPECHLLNLADSVAAMIDKGKPILQQVKPICYTVSSMSGKLFNPDYVEAFLNIATKESFWLSIVSPSLGRILSNQFRKTVTILDMDNLVEVSQLFSEIIDFRSEYTSTHSSGVSASAEGLAQAMGFSQQECKLIKTAGFLHDLGKLATPPEILEKAGKLNDKEYHLIRCHSFYTYNILAHVPNLNLINTWASYHHERLDGKGYPFHLKHDELSLGSRIMAVADVFTAMLEERPYRETRTVEKAMLLLDQMASTSALDGDIIAVLKNNFNAIDACRIADQDASFIEYTRFTCSIE